MFYFGHLMGLQLIKYNIINKLKFFTLEKIKQATFVYQATAFLQNWLFKIFLLCFLISCFNSRSH